MDKLIYIAMSAARHTAANQAVTANNIANVNTDGFKKDFVNVMESQKKTRTRINSEIKSTTPDLSPGGAKATGNKHDIMATSGWLRGIGMDGVEHYISSASLSVDRDGMLVDQGGNLVLSQNSDPIELGRVKDFAVGEDGTISVILPGSEDMTMEIIGSVGIFDMAGNSNKDAHGRLRSSEDPVASERGKINSGYIEGSNVNMAQEMLNMVENSRQYDFSVKLVDSAKSMHDSATRLLR